MATISELYYRLMGKLPDQNTQSRMVAKADYLSANGCHWADFGTRRRFSYDVQDLLVQEMRKHPGFMGTSNPHLAMKHNCKPIGTYAHEAVMAMQAAYGHSNCNRMWMEAWVQEYEGDLGIALPDTVTSDHFFRHQFSMFYSKLFDGVRQDSGSPDEFADKAIAHYKSMGIDPRSKRLVFSDGLDVDKLCRLHHKYKDQIMVQGGIGTNFTNDVGVKPLNMVIKLVAADFGSGFRKVVKLSDDEGKHTGDDEEIAVCKRELFGS